MPYNLDVIDMHGLNEEAAYALGFEALDALDTIHTDAYALIMTEG